MARKNKELEQTRLGIDSIKKEIEKVKEKIAEEVRTEQYGKAYELIKYKEGLEQSIWYLEVFGNIVRGLPMEDQKK